MYEINTMDGSPVKTVVARYVVEAKFKVGGTDDEDRMDSVRMLFEDHYDEIVNNSFLRDSITSLLLDSVKIEDGGQPGEPINP